MQDLDEETFLPFAKDLLGNDYHVVPQQSGTNIDDITPTIGFMHLSDSAGVSGIPFHTDRPHFWNTTKYLVLFCINSDSSGLVETLAVNFFSLLRYLTIVEQNLLAKTKIEWMSKNGRRRIYAPIWDRDFPGNRGDGLVRYSDNIIRWGSPSPDLSLPLPLKNQPILLSVCQRINELADEHAYRFRLQKGSLLIVDNHKMLHGRTRVYDSNRLLKRVWLG